MVRLCKLNKVKENFFIAKIYDQTCSGTLETSIDWMDDQRPNQINDIIIHKD